MTTLKRKIFISLYEKATAQAAQLLKYRLNKMGEEEKLFWQGRLNCTKIISNFLLDEPVIVCHGASVGELNGIFPVIKAIEDKGFKGSIIISTGTFTGYRKSLDFSRQWPNVFAVPAPLDFPESLDNFLSSINPDAFVSFEAEYWPLLYLELSKRKTPFLLLNGRVSENSYKKYKIIKPFIEWLFRTPKKIGAVSPQDRFRLVKLGAKPECVMVTGSSKYDYIFNIPKTKQENHPLRKKLKLSDSTKVFVAGNLRKEECYYLSQLASELTSKLPDTVFILVPRHLHRVNEIKNHLQRGNTSYYLLSEVFKNNVPISNRKAIIVDSIGILFDLYAIGDVNFCGGTLVPVGGHNILEPVVWGKRVIYGPYVSKVFAEHRVLSACGASIQVSAYEELKSVASSLLLRPEKAILDEETLRMIKNHLCGASDLYCQWIMEILHQRGLQWND